MRKFECRVVREDQYEVEFDEAVCNEEWMEEFRKSFYDFYTLEDHAEHIAQCRARHGRGIIEGYGVPLENGKAPYWADRRQINYAINIKVISEDNDVNVDII
ncbi:hypothetical protein [Oceanobacillus kimchii]|uniref:Uncharacterized protein n=1 Tax=Oceanobacillus kimchii TaxID=746691 RepID=A0ABQ5TH87_9BACI|nr:hypothetical protein [Oceanobacillus kimchii]GLO66228.1 hypothetical protein MACH08_20120 [Oceanobacillus kimchii]